MGCSNCVVILCPVFFVQWNLKKLKTEKPKTFFIKKLVFSALDWTLVPVTSDSVQCKTSADEEVTSDSRVSFWLQLQT